MADEMPTSERLGAGAVKIDGRKFLSQNGGARAFGDFYYRAMKVSWPTFFAASAAVFLTINSCFALFYVLGDNPIANARPGSFVDLFFFSVETLATVGFGDMHPQTTFAHVVATVEIFTGMSFLAVMTGLIFARFSRPRARFIFAKHPVVTIHEGRPTLMIRIANERNNTISQALARLWLLRIDTTAEGTRFRRYYELLLDRHEHPMFMLSWSIFHVVDEASPLYGVTPADLAAANAALTLNVSGVDDNSAQYLYARRLYNHQDIRWNYRYRDIT